jgi:hypothetical protein
MNAIQIDLNDQAFRDIFVYLRRTDSFIRFVNEKIISLRGKLFSDVETFETIEAFIIKYVCDWEWFVERLITYLLAKDTSKLAEYLAYTLPKTITFEEASAILNGTKYFDFKNCSDVRVIGKRILTEQNNPFQVIEKGVVKNIDSLYIIRNFIAHKSNKSKNTLRVLYTQSGYSDFMEPGDYLIRRHKDEALPEFTNLYFHTFSLFMSALQMWEFLFPNSLEEFKEDGKITQDSMQKLMLFLTSIPPK